MQFALGVRARGSDEPATSALLRVLLPVVVLFFALTPPFVAAALLVGYPVLPPAMPDWTGPLLLGLNTAQLAGVVFVVACVHRREAEL